MTSRSEQFSDFPVFSIRADRVDTSYPKDWVYLQCSARSAVNGFFPSVADGLKYLPELLWDDIESNYRSAESLPDVRASLVANTGVVNGGLLFVSAIAGSAGEAVAVRAVTAATAVVSAAAVSATSAVTVTISDTASNNSASAVVAAVNGSTAAGTGAANYVTAYLLGGVTDSVKPEDARNSGVGLVAAFGSQTLSQGLTWGDKTVRKFGLVLRVGV